jgi:hypothetical protein
VNSSAIRCKWWNWYHKKKLRLRILRIIQDTLYVITTSVNSMCGLQLFFLIVLIFIEITINLYYNISVMMCGTEVSVHNAFNIILPIIWALIYFVELFFITGSSSLANVKQIVQPRSYRSSYLYLNLTQTLLLRSAYF